MRALRRRPVPLRHPRGKTRCAEQVACGFLCPRRRREQGTIIPAQDAEPSIDIGRMIVEMGGWETHIGANQRCRQFSHQLLERIGLIAEALAEGSGKPVWMTRPVTALVRERGRPCSTRVELFDGRHRDEVCAQVIIGAIASGPQPRRQAIDEALRPRIEPVARWDER